MKRILVLAAGLFFAGAVQAQEPVKFGIKGGVNLSNIIKDDGDNNFDTKMNTGFNVGVTMDLPLGDVFSFTPEVLYATKGYKLKSDLGEFKQTTSFIDIPVLATIKLGESGLNLVAGPQVSFLLSTKNKLDTGFGDVQSEVDEESDQFKKSLVSGVVGLRYDVSENFDIHGRYALDFQKINENGSNNTPEYKNQVFSIGVGYKF
jgi:opacity protein-like surface antigen